MRKTSPSSALGYAINFLLLVGLVCTGVLIIAGVNKRIEINYTIDEHLIFDNLFALNHGAQQTNNGKFQLHHPAGDTTDLTVKNWGAYRIVVARTHHTYKSLTKSAIIGNRSAYSYATIYLPDTRQTIKVCGDTRIEGVVYAGERAVERGHIAGKNYTGDKLVYGEMRKSERYLPELVEDVRNLHLEYFLEDTRHIDLPAKDTSFGFDQQTALVSVKQALVISNRYKGNLILHSFESIQIKAEAQLENVIVIAPRVTFESGFSGTVQVIAHEEVYLEEGVTLRYPSTITLNELSENTMRLPRGIYLQPHASVVGGVLLVSQRPNFRAPVQLKIEQDAVVGGLIYNVGETEVKGKVHGYVYTNSFHLQAGGGEYKNHLLDAEIKSTTLPEELLLPGWIKNELPQKGEVITWF